MTTADAPSKISQLGQSIWYDNIQRNLLKSGELAEMIRRGDIRGVTSNPTIFQKAIANSNDYNDVIQTMSWSAKNAEQIFYQLAIQDIRSAADLFLPLYIDSNKLDGYVSLEVSPYLAHDTEQTISEAKSLWQEVNRPNLMIKIPATLAGIPAIKEVIVSGINVNVTLIFSIERYEQVIDAYLQGIESRINSNLLVNQIASVASFFVSRVDSKVDALLTKKLNDGASHDEINPLFGKAAIANAALAYTAFEKAFFSTRFEELKKHGAQYQRPLWASTSTKNPAYSDLMYVESLITPNSVNTVPPQTLDAIRDHCTPVLNLSKFQKTAHETLQKIESVGISFSEVTKELELDGVQSFADSFTALLETIEERRISYIRELGTLSHSVAKRLKILKDENVVPRLFSKDPSIWSDNPIEQNEISNRLGWLDSPAKSLFLVNEIMDFAIKQNKGKITNIVLLGMGGSSMAPEVFAAIGNAFNMTNNGAKLTILDTSDPVQILDAVRTINPLQTLYIAASKSGSTIEVETLLAYFWDLLHGLLGDNCSEHFVAITDPGSNLESLAKEKGFAKVFSGDPAVGGRYSALSAFGLVPAALCGINISDILSSAVIARQNSLPECPMYINHGVVLGAILGEAALAGKNKLTILSDPEVASFGAWLEQLIAESSGKDGKGIIPIDEEPVFPSDFYHDDRIFVYFKSSGAMQEIADNLLTAGQTVITEQFTNGYSIGSQMFYWELATAIACAILGVNAFNQPDVQDSKTRTQANINTYKETGKLDTCTAQFSNDKLDIFSNYALEGNSHSMTVIIQTFLKNAQPQDYIAIHAYLPRNEYFGRQLLNFRKRIMQLTGCATTLGYGPRFLHSTGQLHKGGPDNCTFVQITMDNSNHDIAIPGKPYTFGILQSAQAQGDLEALQFRKRQYLRIHLKTSELPEI